LVFGAQRFPPALQELIDEGYVTAISEDKTADLFATASTKFSSTLYKSLALSGAIAGVTSLNMEEVFTNMPVVGIRRFEVAAADLLAESAAIVRRCWTSMASNWTR
jgi:hypothetical protein